MSRYMDADKLIRKYIDTDIEKFSNSDVKIVLENLKQNILRAPSIDICFCRECKYWHSNTQFCDKWSHGGFISQRTLPNDFCSYGEREGE